MWLIKIVKLNVTFLALSKTQSSVVIYLNISNSGGIFSNSSGNSVIVTRQSNLRI